MNKEKIIEEALKRTPIEGLEWILEDDRFGFGINWSENDLPVCEEEWAGYYVQRAIDALKEQAARIRELEEKLRLLEYGDQDVLQSGMMPAT